MEKLPCFDYLAHVEADRESAALKGRLRCSCGCETFRLYHSGKQAHPWLGSWYCSWITAGRDTLLIDAHCTACGKSIPLHCDDRGKNGWRRPAGQTLTEFVHPKLHDQRVRVEVVYGWENAGAQEDWSTAYTDFCLDVWNDEHPRKIRIFE